MGRKTVLAAILALVAFSGLAAFTADRVFPKAAPKVAVEPVSLRPAYCDPITGVGRLRAAAVVEMFVLTTVFSDGHRPAPECSYDYVTDALKRGDTRAEWAEGNIHVVPFVVDYLDSNVVRSGVKPGSVRWSHNALEVVIVMEGVLDRAIVRQEYLLRLVHRGEWKVNFWQPLFTPAGPTGPNAKS